MQNIILLHGALGAASDLEPLATALKNEGAAVHSFSFSGHGAATFQDGFGIEQFSQELENYILHFHLKPAVIFGYSMGGFVALYLASKKPDLIKKIITLGTKFNWSAEAVEKETEGLQPDRMLEKIPAFSQGLQTKHGNHWQELVTRTAGLMKEIGEKNFLSTEILKTITTPVMLGIGDRDKMVTLEETMAVYKTLPNAAMYMLPDTKHPIETIDRELLCKLILCALKLHIKDT